MRRWNFGLFAAALLLLTGGCSESATAPNRHGPTRSGAATIRADSSATHAADTNTESALPDTLGENGRNGGGFIGSGH